MSMCTCVCVSVEVFVHARAHVYVSMCMPGCHGYPYMHGDQRTIQKMNLSLSPFTMWVPRIELRTAGLASVFIH